MFGKQYYLATKFVGGELIRHVWHCSHSTAVILAKSYDLILPLDRKPRGCADVREGGIEYDSKYHRERWNKAHNVGSHLQPRH